MSFVNDLVVNSIEAQTIYVQDSLEVPSIKIAGVVFNGDVSGGVTLPYLDSNYVKKTDATVLQEITSNPSQTLFSKKVNAPEIVSSKVTVTDIYTNNQNVTDNSCVNVSYVNNLFPKKTDVYTKTASDAITNTKLNSTDFASFQQTNANNIATKANIGSSYLKSETDSLLTAKVDNSAFGNYQSSVTTALNTKTNSGDAYTKPQVDNLLSGKLGVTYGSSNDTAVASKVSQYNFDQFMSTNTSNLANKADSSSVYTKTQSDNLLGNKIDSTTFSTYQTANSNALNQRVLTSDFNNFQTSNTTVLNTKVSTTDFGLYQANNNTALAAKYNISDFNSFNAQNNTALAGKVASSDFSTYVQSTNMNVGNRVLQTDYDSNKASVTASIATKADKTTTYSKTETDGKDAFIQSSLDSYKSSNDAAVLLKLDKTIYDSNKIQTDGSIAAKVNQSQYDTYVGSNDTSVANKTPLTAFNSYMSTNEASVAMKANTSDVTAALNGKQPLSSNLTNINQNLSTTSSPTFGNVTVSSAPVNNTDLSNKSYVDSTISNSVSQAGTGLTKTGTTLSVNASQPQLTSIGPQSTFKATSALIDSIGVNVASNISITSDISSSNKLKLTGTNTDQFLVANAANIFRVDGSTGSTFVLSTTDSINASTGAFQVYGGVGISKSLTVLGLQTSSGAINVLNTATNGSAVNAFSATGGALSIAGDLNLLHSTVPRMVFNGAGVLEPTFTTRSKGAKIVLLPALTTTSSDFAIGISSGSLWSGVPDTLGFFRWFGGTTLAASMSGTGALSLGSSLTVGTTLTAAGLSTLAAVNMSGALNCQSVNAIGASTFKGLSDLMVCDFSNNSGLYGLRIKAGIEQGVGSTVDFLTFGNSDKSFLTISNNGSNAKMSLPTTFLSTINQDIFETASLTNYTTATQSNARSLVIKSKNSVSSTFDALELRDNSDIVQFSANFNGYCRTKGPLFSAGGQLLFGDGLQSSPDLYGATCGDINVTGNNNSARLSLRVFNSGSTLPDVFRVLSSKFTASSPLLAVSGIDGSVSGGVNNTAFVLNRNVTSATTQTGVAFTKTTDLVNYTKSANLVNVGIQFVTTAASGTSSSGLNFTLPFACAFSGVMDTAYVLRNGTVTSCRLTFTTGSTTVVLTTSNGVGGFANPSVQADSWYIIMNYISQ